MRRLLHGERRLDKAQELRCEYDAGASIRGLARRHELSYGTVRTLLLQAGTTLRGRGGRRARLNTPGEAR
ncbi:helix-turn-helix domain-containing protein [Streptomyces sp. NPDC059063]|uniref:helix-turn-helix domain-containing protein n=1 Tax=Streptomyces sp. NPDC059063 TaxID=3346712 RepID=UPI0036C0F325